MATKQPKQKKLNIDAIWIIEHRSANNMNQTQFWRQYGVTQSGGSRYENGRNIPLPVRMLIALETGMASLEELITGKLRDMV